MAPILVIAIAIASLFYDRQAVQDLVIAQIGGLAGSQGGELIATMLEASRDIGSNSLAIGVSIAALIFGATGVFGQLQDALNTIWEVAPKPGQGLLSLVKETLLFLHNGDLGRLSLVDLASALGRIVSADKLEYEFIFWPGIGLASSELHCLIVCDHSIIRPDLQLRA